MRKLSFRTRDLLKDSSGLATIEFAFASTALIYGLLNGLEAARYSFQKMEVANAVHAAAHAVWNACDTKHLPAMSNCTARTAAYTNGLASTSLGTSVTLKTGFPTEGYYCLTSAGAITKQANYDQTKPTCSAVGGVAYTAGDDFAISATYAYTPMFGRKLTIGYLLPTTITASSIIRLQ
jgi:Flp pilus assembly protein TadG